MPPPATRANLFAGVATTSSSLNASRPAERATATPGASAAPAGATPAAPLERAVAAVIARTSPVTSTTAEAAAPRVPTLVSTRMARAWMGTAFTGVWKVLTTAVTGRAPTWVPILTTAVPAETSAPDRPRTATRGHAVRFSASVVRRCAVVFARRFSLTHQTAADAEWCAVPARTALAVCANQRSPPIGENNVGHGPCSVRF